MLVNLRLNVKVSNFANYPAPIRISAFIVLLGLLWLPLAAPIALWSREPNRTTILVMSLLFVEFLLLMRWWGNHVYHEPQIFQAYGLSWTRLNLREFFQGLGWGLSSLLCLFILQATFGWLSWQLPERNILPIVLEGLVVGLGTGLAEELVFRGWILRELEHDYPASMALWANSLLFATLHFIKPLPEAIRTFPQFPGLVLLGLILVWMKRSTSAQRRTDVSLKIQPGRLGLPIGFHAGLVWGYYVLKVGGLMAVSRQVPEWLTGIDGNPLAGLAGLILLTGLAIYWGRLKKKYKPV